MSLHHGNKETKMITTFLSKNEVLRIAQLTPPQVNKEIAEWNSLWSMCYRAGDTEGKAEAKAMALEIRRVYDQVRNYAKMEAEVITLLNEIGFKIQY
jgi:hypothetical protein